MGDNGRPVIVAVVNEKGGVGKSTTSVSLADGLVRRGKSVLAIDLDAQMNLYEWLMPPKSTKPKTTIFTALRLAEPTDIAAAIVPTIVPGLDVVAGDRRLGVIENELSQFNRPLRRLRAILKESKAIGKYDYVLLDCAPSVGRLLLNSIVAADRLLIPCTASSMALKGVRKVLGSVDDLSSGEDAELTAVPPMRVLFTKFNPSTKISKAARKRVETKFGLTAYKTHIRTCIRAEEAPDFNETLMTYDPQGTTTLDYETFTEEFLNG